MPSPRSVPSASLSNGRMRSRPRERAELAEDVERRHGHPDLRAAGERQVALAVEQVAHRELDRDERRRARGVDRVARAHQVEPVGDPPDDDVRDEPRHGLGADRRQRPLHLLAEQLDLVVRVLGVELLEHVERLADDEPALHGDRVAAVQVRALAEHDPGPGADLGRQVGAAGVVERVVRELEREPLVGLAADRDRRDAVGERVEGRERARGSRRACRRSCRCRRSRVVVGVDVPRLRRRVGDRVDLAEDVPPVGVDVRRAREHAGHADDRDAVARAACISRATPASRLSALLPMPWTFVIAASSRPSGAKK